MMNIATLAKITLCSAFITFSLIGTSIPAHAGSPHVRVFDGVGIASSSEIETSETSEQMTVEQEDEAANERPREAYFVNVDHGTTTQ